MKGVRHTQLSLLLPLVLLMAEQLSKVQLRFEAFQTCGLIQMQLPLAEPLVLLIAEQFKSQVRLEAFHAYGVAHRQLLLLSVVLDPLE